MEIYRKLCGNCSQAGRLQARRERQRDEYMYVHLDIHTYWPVCTYVYIFDSVYNIYGTVRYGTSVECMKSSRLKALQFCARLGQAKTWSRLCHPRGRCGGGRRRAEEEEVPPRLVAFHCGRLLLPVFTRLTGFLPVHCHSSWLAAIHQLTSLASCPSTCPSPSSSSSSSSTVIQLSYKNLNLIICHTNKAVVCQNIL